MDYIVKRMKQHGGGMVAFVKGRRAIHGGDNIDEEDSQIREKKVAGDNGRDDSDV